MAMVSHNDRAGIEFAIVVPATQKRLLLLLRTPGKNGLVAMARMDRWSMVFAQRRATRRGIEFAIKNPPQGADSIRLLWDAE